MSNPIRILVAVVVAVASVLTVVAVRHHQHERQREAAEQQLMQEVQHDQDAVEQARKNHFGQAR